MTRALLGSLALSMALAFAATADETMLVAVDVAGGVYHERSCARIPKHVATMDARTASERYKACTLCCPLCAVAKPEAAAATDSTALAPLAAARALVTPVQAAAARKYDPETEVVVDTATRLFHLPSCAFKGPRTSASMKLRTMHGTSFRPCFNCLPGAEWSDPDATANDDASTTSTSSASSGGSSGGGTVHVKGYTRKDGTYVRPHTRRKPRKD